MEQLLKKLLGQCKHPAGMQEVFEFARHAYREQQYLGHEPYLNHALRVALTVSAMGLDETTVQAALLYHAAGGRDETANRSALEEIRRRFGQDAATLVAGASRHNLLFTFIADTFKDYDLSNEQRIENLRKLFLAAGRDARAVLINLASRRDLLGHCGHLPADAQKRAAAETLRLHVPVANRLGLGGMKAALEDQAFELLMPEKFKLMHEKIKENYDERQRHLQHFIPAFKRMLHRERIAFLEVSYRAKSYWSTYQKLVKKGMDFSKIYDLAALRVMMRDIPACYRALGIIHQRYQPITGEIDDYISRPKPNGYRSLHTAVFLEPGRVSEIQIRTPEMHREAEYGICAHWQYKENVDPRRHDSWNREIAHFKNGGTVDFFDNQIFVFTPRGDIISLPEGATPVDFAYAIHSEIGNHCEQAKIGGGIVPLSRELNTGEVVEIITRKNRRPSPDWLKFVKTGFAKGHIKKATAVIINPILSAPAFVAKKFLGFSEKLRQKRQKPSPKTATPKMLRAVVGGQHGIKAQFARCCNPQRGEPVVAYVSKHRAAVLHKESCKNFQKLSAAMPHKTLGVFWREA